MIHQNKEIGELISKYFPESEYQIDAEIIPNPPKEYIETFFVQLSEHENYENLKDDFIYDKEHDIFIHIHNRFSKKELEGLTQEQIFFYPFMNKDEILAAFNINSSEDYLLRLRAEQVENNARLKRTLSKLKKHLGDKWSFRNYFDSKQYQFYLRNLCSEKRIKCKKIPHGTIHSSEANGMCLKTKYGNIIVLSYALRSFLYYMNVFYFGDELGIKKKDQFQSFVLAIRIMMGTESLDFEIDPRGRLPKSINRQLEFKTYWQMNFIIGHEYAHHYLGHLEKAVVRKMHISISATSTSPKKFTHRHKCEYDADSNSILQTTFNDSGKSELLDGAFLFFFYLDMYTKVEDYMFPRRLISS